MLVTFHCKAWSSIIMTRDIAVTLLKMAGHSATVPSAIRGADASAALARLNQGLAAAEPDDTASRQAQRKADDSGEPPPIGIRLRAFPLIQMLTAAATHGDDVTWEDGAPVI